MALNAKVGSQNQTVDGLTIFSEAVTITATADGTNVLNVGTGKIAATVIVDTPALDTSADETYVVEVRGSNDAFGGVDELLASTEVKAAGRETFAVDNVCVLADGSTIICDSIKVAVVLAGTTPSMTYSARLGSLLEG